MVGGREAPKLAGGTEVISHFQPAKGVGLLRRGNVALGQSRHSGCEPVTSALHPTPDKSPRSNN
jgi:hypothetical protein